MSTQEKSGDSAKKIKKIAQEMGASTQGAIAGVARRIQIKLEKKGALTEDSKKRMDEIIPVMVGRTNAAIQANIQFLEFITTNPAIINKRLELKQEVEEEKRKDEERRKEKEEKEADVKGKAEAEEVKKEDEPIGDPRTEDVQAEQFKQADNENVSKVAVSIDKDRAIAEQQNKMVNTGVVTQNAQIKTYGRPSPFNSMFHKQFRNRDSQWKRHNMYYPYQNIPHNLWKQHLMLNKHAHYDGEANRNPTDAQIAQNAVRPVRESAQRSREAQIRAMEPIFRPREAPPPPEPLRE